MKRSHRLAVICLVPVMAMLVGCASEVKTVESRVLEEGWRIQSSEAVTAPGEDISSQTFDASGWIPTSMPSTVMAALVRAGELPDPLEGRNLETTPSEPFEVPWWYRTEFTVDMVPADARLVFDGINYRAELWLNGERIAEPDEVFGAFRVFEFDVTALIHEGANVLAVKVTPPVPGEPTIGFVDWNPSAPDRYMGLWREVTLRMTAGVSLDEVWVRGDVDPANLDEGRISVVGRLTNRTDQRVTAVVRGRIGPGDAIEFSHEVNLEPKETHDLNLGPEQYRQLVIDSPRLWWPNNLGEPNLYDLELEAVVGKAVSDRHEINFGIRHTEDYLNEEGHRGYTINGKKVLVRGGGWVDDVMLFEDPQRLEDQILYVKHMNLNTIRLEGFWGNTHTIFDLADRYGIMIWVGWSCQWEWEDYLGQPVDETYGGIDTPEEMDLITRSWRDQVVRLRNHPSIVVWNLGSDMLPRPELEARYRDVLKEVDPTRPPLGACATATSDVSGPTAVKMNGPYEWVPPNYWYEEPAPGGAFGFNTETGPGAQPPVAESIRRMLPRESWWPIDEEWAYHSARNEFKNLDRYVAALDARYGPASDLDEFAMKAQLANYEAMRGMFESFSLRRPVATGVIQWMLNAAWPKMFWQLYDYYLVPTGAFYAARNSCQPVHVALDHGTNTFVAVNDTDTRLEGTAHIRVLDANSGVLLDETRPLDLAPDERNDVLVLPEKLRSGFRFVDARIEAKDGALLHVNFYWLPDSPDVMAWDKGEWFYTPVGTFADLKAVNRLPQATLDAEHRFASEGDGTEVEVTLHNSGEHVAFFVELAVLGSESGALAAPIFWDDNYVSILPGETRTIRGTFPSHALKQETPVFRYGGINVGRK